MSEERCQRFPDQFYVCPPHEDKATNFPEEENDAPEISFQSFPPESPYEGQWLDDCEQNQSRISVHDFYLPKFQMRLAANQGNLQQLALLLAGKRTREKRCLRPKLEELTPENTMPANSSVNHLESIDKTKRYAFPDTLPEILHSV